MDTNRSFQENWKRVTASSLQQPLSIFFQRHISSSTLFTLQMWSRYASLKWNSVYMYNCGYQFFTLLYINWWARTSPFSFHWSIRSVSWIILLWRSLKLIYGNFKQCVLTNNWFILLNCFMIENWEQNYKTWVFQILNKTYS